MRPGRFRLSASLLAATGIALSLTGCLGDARALPGSGDPAPGGSSTTASGAASGSVPGTASPRGSALAALRTLPVKGRAPKTGYTRERFGQAWSDAIDVPGGHYGCDRTATRRPGRCRARRSGAAMSPGRWR